MCIIIAKPKGKKVPSKYLKNSRSNNKDGVGLMYAESGKVIIKKWLDSDYETFLETLEGLTNKNVVIHYRAASVGAVSLDNIHPFWVFEERLAMCHNGTIFNAKALAKKDESDTVAFARLLRDFPDDFLQRDGLLLMMKSYIGTSSRLAFLDANGSIAIVNKQLGDEVDGVWYSNTYYKSPNQRGYGCSVEFPTSRKRVYGSYNLFECDVRGKKLPKKYTVYDRAKTRFHKVFVFVYGTLKKGYGNNRLLETSEFIGNAVTIKKFPMIGEGGAFPYMLDIEGDGFNVKGELWKVDEATLLYSLDSLEGYPGHYVRKVIDVATTTDVYQAVAYFKADIRPSDKLEKYISEWTRRDERGSNKNNHHSEIFIEDTINGYEDTTYRCLVCDYWGDEREFIKWGCCPECMSDAIEIAPI